MHETVQETTDPVSIWHNHNEKFRTNSDKVVSWCLLLKFRMRSLRLSQTNHDFDEKDYLISTS